MKRYIWVGLVIVVLAITACWAIGNQKAQKSDDTEKIEKVAKSSSSKEVKSSSSSSETMSSGSSKTKEGANPINLDEAQVLLAQVLLAQANGEWPSDNVKILSQTANKTTIGGGIGAKGYDVITFVNEGNQVKIHEVFGTMGPAGQGEIPGAEGTGAHPMDGVLPKDYTIQR
ncbi:hypothetical protein [Eupransor demetentiae]|uniref:Lipoprotein n=1 Tax=Eupransor demetentiae TaxID=3109584 RepID=A0ABP0EQJ3_9LACO|nr:hypothetical protein R54876_GBNLAHCA_01104 [Lactobacillaceae bacterium LMG 33000]